MLSGFLTWWSEQLLSLLRLAPRLGVRRDAVVARMDGPGTLAVSVRRQGRDGALGRFELTPQGLAALRAALGPRRLPLEVSLPPGTLLEQTVVLPLAAERDVGRVLRYEMDRLTPFAADELFWAWAVQQRDRARAQVQVRLTLVLKAQLSSVLETLGKAGLAPVALVGGPGQRIGLLDVAPQRWRRRAVSALAALCVGLAITAAAIPFVQQSRAAHRIERQIAALRPATDRAEALRRTMATAATGIDGLAAQRARVGDALSVLATLTELLPDDTVLTDLTLKQRVLGISGQSNAAARLIALLSADPGLRNPVFAAPVTRIEASRGEGFSIRAEALP